MTSSLRVKTLSDRDLLARLHALVDRSYELESELVAHIAEVDARRLFVAQACPSMFAYCTERLHLSEHAAYRRIEVARATRRFPQLLSMLADGRLHLSGAAKLSRHLTADNCDQVLGRAAHQSTRAIERLVAELSPAPEVPATMRKLPARTHPPKKSAQVVEDSLGARRAVPDAPVPQPFAPAWVPIASARYKVQFTASAELHDKLQRLQSLMRHQVPDGSLADVIDAAVTAELERRQAQRFGKVRAPRKNVEDSDTSARTRYVPAAVKRAVFERDEHRCTFVDPRGHRCSARDPLEIDHIATMHANPRGATCR